ncbi:hypothetical protein BACI_pBAslCI1400100 (plasmid) [Bacillus cereus biovar anthracis str. CI]|nr:hypothetical protein BACI_pBAslCI1400100 [Bacillus cereus biovar anthracis str. CI]
MLKPLRIQSRAVFGCLGVFHHSSSTSVTLRQSGFTQRISNCVEDNCFTFARLPHSSQRLYFVFFNIIIIAFRCRLIEKVTTSDKKVNTKSHPLKKRMAYRSRIDGRAAYPTSLVTYLTDQIIDQERS